MMGSVLLSGSSQVRPRRRDRLARRHAKTDAYFVVHDPRLPQLPAGGRLTFHHTFIPIVRAVRGGGKEDELRSPSRVATVMGISMLFFIVLGEFLAGRVILAPGFRPREGCARGAPDAHRAPPPRSSSTIGGLLMAVHVCGSSSSRLAH
jgi:hypothetical protein